MPIEMQENKQTNVGSFSLKLAALLLGISTLVLVVSYKEDSETAKKSLVNMGKLVACDFEVFGIVQGVFFRKHTEKQAKVLGVRGWCMNTRDDTVKGQLEGEQKPVEEMKSWLQTKGSPQSRIDKTVFSAMRDIENYTFNGFGIKH